MSQSRPLVRLGACDDAVKWASTFPSLNEAWRACGRGDWMLWLAARIGIDRREVVRVACRCARLALPHVRAGEDRPRVAIETAERWCAGQATIDEVRAAATAAAAYAADVSAYAAADAAAAAAAAAAAYAADASAYAADASAYAADASAYAADASAYAAARTNTLRACADLARPLWPLVEAALAAARPA